VLSPAGVGGKGEDRRLPLGCGMTTRWLPGLLPCLLLLLAFPASAEPVPRKLAAEIEALLRGEGDPGALAKRLQGAKVGFPELEAHLRRAERGEPPQARGRVSEVPIRCEHVDYETIYYVYVPKTYDPLKPTSLVLVGHGGNGAMQKWRARQTAKSYLSVWHTAAERHGFIAVAPATERGWGAIGNSLLVSTINQIRAGYRINPDRVYVTGHSMGGHLSWRSAISLGDRWGAVAPMSGGYDYVARGQMPRLFGVPGYVTWSRNEPYGIADHNRKMAKWFAKRPSFDWKTTERGGSHELYADEPVKMASFFAQRPRNLYRRRVYAELGGALGGTKPGSNPRWRQAHTWKASRPLSYSLFHWVRFLEPSAKGKPGKVWARITGPNRIELTTSNVARLRLYLHPRLVDLETPVEVFANGKRVLRKRVRPDLGVALELLAYSGDAGRIFHAALDVELSTQGEVPEPTGPAPTPWLDSVASLRKAVRKQASRGVAIVSPDTPGAGLSMPCREALASHPHAWLAPGKAGQREAGCVIYSERGKVLARRSGPVDLAWLQEQLVRRHGNLPASAKKRVKKKKKKLSPEQRAKRLWGRALNYRANGLRGREQRVLQDLLRTHPKSTFVPRARRRLAELQS
jgi:pimeloyl-ACP methyl ester carboxylesterase